MRIKRIVEKAYNKINPSYKHIKRTRDLAVDIQRQIMELRRELNSLESMDYSAITDNKAYRYLYLRRYIKGGERVLDVESCGGTGAQLLYINTPISEVECIDSIEYYSNLGKVYHQEEELLFQYATIFDVKKKYDVIACFDDKRNEAITEEYFRRLVDCLDMGAILGVAISKHKVDSVLAFVERLNVSVDRVLYQLDSNPELQNNSNVDENVVAVIYIKNEHRDNI